MPPKIDPGTVTTIFIRTVGGQVGAVSTLAPKLGPLGLSPKKIGEQLSNATVNWEGLRVMCKLKVQNRQATVEVVPSAAVLLIKSLNEPLRDRKKVKGVKHDGNITMKNVILISKLLRNRSLSINLEGTIKEILGTAKSIGCKII
jgi:large subunit ribosomal protein L12e